MNTKNTIHIFGGLEAAPQKALLDEIKIAENLMRVYTTNDTLEFDAELLSKDITTRCICDVSILKTELKSAFAQKGKR